eukprot:8731197-Alexandrium_andersonii.AAC.1
MSAFRMGSNRNAALTRKRATRACSSVYSVAAVSNSPVAATVSRRRRKRSSSMERTILAMSSSWAAWRSASSDVSPIRAAAACTRESDVPSAEPPRDWMPSVLRIIRLM